MQFRTLRILTFAAVLLTSVPSSLSQSLLLQHITVDDGLSQDIVTTIAQDKEGFMWFGTEDGLNVYDGYSMTVFKRRPYDSTSLLANGIGKLLCDAMGSLWVGSGDGLNHIDTEQRRISRVILSPDAHPQPMNINDLAEGSDSSLWIATSNGLYRRRADGRITHPTTEVTDSVLRFVYVDRYGVLFCATTSRLYRYTVAGDSLIPLADTPALASSHGYRITSMVHHSGGTYVVGTVNGGIYHFSHDWKSVTQYQVGGTDGRSLSDDRVLALTEDLSGQIWIGTFLGLDGFNPESGVTKTYHRAGSGGTLLKGERVYSLFVERTGAVWIGTYRGGVNRFDPHLQRFRAAELETIRQLGARNVLSILGSTTGDLWVGTDEGLFIRDRRNRIRHYAYRPGINGGIGSNTVSVLYQRHNGEIWVGGGEGSISRYSPAKDAFVTMKLQNENAVVRAIGESPQGTLLVGTDYSGVYVLDHARGEFVSWSPPSNTLTEGGVWSIFQDSRGFLWLGTWALPHILRIDPTGHTAKRFRYEQENRTTLQNPAVRSFIEDKEGNIWMGTWGGGLGKYHWQTETFSWYTEQEGLPNSYIKSMQMDDRGRLWIASERGLVQFDPSSNRFILYTIRDGLRSDFFWSGSSWKGNDGTIYFGGVNGLEAFHPDSIRENPHIPPVVITNMRVLDKPTVLPSARMSDHTVTIPYESDFFSFEFVALDYTRPEQNSYMYMLEGFDKEWIQAGTRRYASYTHLDPGEYIFRVIGSNGDGIWNNAGTSVNILITPPFWMTWWFRALGVTLIAGVLYGVYRYKLRKALEVERLRRDISRDLHDDVGTKLSAIVLASQVMEQKHSLPGEVRQELDTIRDITLKAQQLMRDIVWMLNPRNDVLHLFVARMKEETARLLRTIPYNMETPSSEPEWRLNPAMKRNIFLLYLEGLNNIVRHSEATHVSIRISISGKQLHVHLCDNGIGFNTGHTSTGSGLSNMYARAKQIDGRLSIQSTPGKGTEIRLVVPIA